MQKYFILFFVSLFSWCFSQQIEFKYEFEVCYESKIVQRNLYDSKTGVFSKTNLDRFTFSDTIKINEEKFEAIVILDSFQKNKIIQEFLKSKIKRNTIKDPFYDDYSTTKILFYKDNELINTNFEYINDETEVKNFKNIEHTLQDFIESNNEYKKVFPKIIW